MSSDAGGPTAPPPPAYPPPGYAQVPPGYYPPAGYAPPGYPPPSGYYPPPRYSGFPPPGYPPPGRQPMGPPPALKPGIIPLRPLGMGDIFNAAVSYIRANPKATLGLTTVVVVVAQVVALLLQIGPLASSGLLSPSTLGGVDQSDPTQFSGPAEFSDSSIVGLLLSTAAGTVTTVLGAIVLSGLLTVVVGRAVFGATIGVGEAWRRVRGRLLPLLGITVLEAVGATAIIAIVVGVVFAVAEFVGGAAAFVVGAILGLAVVAALAYLYTILSFAPTLIVLERIGVGAAITRSFRLVRGDFWRVFGIQLLAVVVASVISGAVTVPFSLVGQVMLVLGGSTSTTVIALVLMSVGGAIGQIITAPFSAGVVVLLYADRRIRAEAFDLVLQTGATGTVGSTDDLWLTPHR